MRHKNIRPFNTPAPTNYKLNPDGNGTHIYNQGALKKASLGDIQCEIRGIVPTYRTGDMVQMLHGNVFRSLK